MLVAWGTALEDGNIFETIIKTCIKGDLRNILYAFLYSWSLTPSARKTHWCSAITNNAPFKV